LSGGSAPIRNRYNLAVIIFLSSLAVTFAAFCVRLAVRFVNRRERWARRLLIGIAASTPVLYALSIGPAAYVASRNLIPDEIVNGLEKFYAPIFWIVDEGPEPIRGAATWYLELWWSMEPASITSPIHD
jgi:hypothetical protein